MERGWVRQDHHSLFDDHLEPEEQLPRQFYYRFTAKITALGHATVEVADRSGAVFGNSLTDNAHEEDGYRFHDVMHFAFAAFLGWSPVVRKLLGRKRKKDPKTDEVEDGGRAAVIDEAIVAMIFDYIDHDLAATSGMTRVDSETLRSIRALTRGFEVHTRTESEWEAAILAGLSVWRDLQLHGGGEVFGDLRHRTFHFSRQ